jgi:hypothetical protein
VRLQLQADEVYYFSDFDYHTRLGIADCATECGLYLLKAICAILKFAVKAPLLLFRNWPVGCYQMLKVAKTLALGTWFGKHR